MNDTNNRFEKNTANKFGDVFKSTFQCPQNMMSTVDQAIPIYCIFRYVRDRIQIEILPCRG